MALLTKAVLRRRDGALAQLVERYTGSVEVRGSTPLGSTNLRSSFGWQARPLWRQHPLPKFRHAGAESVQSTNCFSIIRDVSLLSRNTVTNVETSSG